LGAGASTAAGAAAPVLAEAVGVTDLRARARFSSVMAIEDRPFSGPAPLPAVSQAIDGAAAVD
jgi:hypothetical protein